MQTAVYIRVSTEEQAKEGYSITAQKERLDAFAKSQGWTIIEYYIEEGQSAKNLNRPEIQRLITDIKRKDIGVEVILIYRLDRLTRSVLDLYELLKIFEENKVAFRSATEIYDTTTAMGRLFITLVAALAQWERENLAERVRMGMAEMARQGRRPGTKEPYGYNYVDGNLVVNLTEATTVKKIYDMYYRGYGVRKIVNWLNNYPVPSKTGGPWSDTTVSYIITNPLYVGKFAWGREDTRKYRNVLRAVQLEHVYQGSHEAIIDEETWSAIQLKFTQKKKLAPRHASSNYPLTGILVCGMCGSSLNGSTSVQKSMKGTRKVRWYKCSTRDHRQTCTLPYVRAETVEKEVLEQIEKMTNMEVLQQLGEENLREENIKVASEEKLKLNIELKEILNKKKKWFDAYENGIIELYDLRDRLKSISDKESFIGDRLADIKIAEEESPVWTLEEKLEKMKNLQWLWEKATPEEQKELMRELINEITIASNRKVSVKLK